MAQVSHTSVLYGRRDEGPAQRRRLKSREAVEQFTKALGGRMEAFYYAFGDEDVYAIADMPDNATMAACALAINASGAVKVKTTVLLTAEEVDQATKMTANYRAPGR